MDGDGKPALDDACPTVFGTLANGCPAPVVVPPVAQVSSVSAKASKRSARVVVKTTGPATVRITVERKRGSKWVRVTRKTIVSVGNAARLTVKRLKVGRHRVRISISSSAGRGTPVTKSFRVR